MGKKVKMTRRLFQIQNKLELTQLCWTRVGCYCYFVTLSSPVVSKRSLSNSWDILLKRVVKEYGSRPEYVRIVTSEGNGVIHALWSFKDALPRIYLWLKAQWLDIHGAWNVWVKAVGRTREDAVRLSSYMVRQYLVGQSNEDGTSAVVSVVFSRCISMPYSVSRFIADVRKMLRSEVEHWMPWTITYGCIMEACRSLVTVGTYRHKKGYVFACNEFTGNELVVLERP